MAMILIIKDLRIILLDILHFEDHPQITDNYFN